LVRHLKRNMQFKSLAKKINIRTLIGFALSGLLLWLTMRQSELDWEDLSLDNNQWHYFIGAMIAFMVSIWVQAMRAKFIWVDGKRKYQDIDTYSGFIVGNFYNCVLPANLGDGVRAYHFSQKHKVLFLRALAFIITEKWLDALVFVFYVSLLFLIKPFSPHVVSYTLLFTGILIVFLWVLYYFMGRYRKLEKNLWFPVLFVSGKLGRYLYRLYIHATNHIQGLKSRGTLGYYISGGIFAFILNNVQFILLMEAVGIQAPINSLYMGFLISVSTMVIAIIPSAPSNIGVMHYGTYLVFLFAADVYHVIPNPEELKHYALFGVYMHLSYFIPEVLIGIVYVAMERNVLFDKKISNIWSRRT